MANDLPLPGDKSPGSSVPLDKIDDYEPKIVGTPAKETVAKRSSKSSDDQQRARKNKLENEQTQTEIDEHKQKIRRDDDEHQLLLSLRNKHSKTGFWIVATWQICIISIVLLQGFNAIHLQTPVLLALITTTTINVLGLLVIVMKYVFPPSSTNLRQLDEKPQSRTRRDRS